jgi:hypothetical protein
MHSTLTPKPSDDPHDIVVVAPDAVRVAPSDQEISHLMQQAARFHSEAQARAASDVSAGATVPPVDTTFRPAAVDGVLNDSPGSPRRSIGGRAGRDFAALLLAACIGAAAVGWQAFGYAGKKLIAKWVPQFALTTSLPLEKLWPSARPAPPADEADAADPAAPQAAQPAQTAAAEAVAPAAAAPSPDSAPSLQSMARDLASVSQEVEQLKASIAELKAGQQQIARDAAKASDNKAAENRAAEQNARAKLALAPPRPAVARPRKPAPPYSPAQAAGAPPLPQAAAPYAPQAAAPQAGTPQAGTPYVPRQAEPVPPAVVQLPPEPGFASAPRPPMPVQ